jgi:hypothetical protein
VNFRISLCVFQFRAASVLRLFSLQSRAASVLRLQFRAASVLRLQSRAASVLRLQSRAASVLRLRQQLAETVAFRNQVSDMLIARMAPQTMTMYIAAKINLKIIPNRFYNQSPGKLGTALQSIFKMLCKAVPNFPGD